jgi:transposase
VLQDADLKLCSVMSDILGVSGRQTLSQLAKGHSDPAALAELARQFATQAGGAAPSADRRFNPHHAFVLSRLLADLDNVEESMVEVAQRIEAQLLPFEAQLKCLCTIPGVKQVGAAAIVAEIGTDMSCFPDTTDLDSWAGMALANNESGGKRRRAKARKGNRWLRTILVECGHAAGRTCNTALSALYRRMIVRGWP